MKRKIIDACLIFMLIFVLFQNHTIYSPSSAKITDYIDSGPIYRGSNADFEAYYPAADGSPGNPYIIENLNITIGSGHCIHIENTDVYFVIRNNLLDGEENQEGWQGIHLDNVTHGTIENNTIINCYNGINLDPLSDWNIIANNTISNTYSDGILLSSNYNLLFNNTISNVPIGIKCNEGSHNIIDNNTIYDTYGSYSRGIDLGPVTNNTLSDNTIYNASEGIHGETSCVKNVISGNNIYNISQGIYLGSLCDHNNLTDNTISDTYGDGIWLYDTNHSIITGNTVFDTTIGIRLTGSHNILTENTICNTTSSTYGYGVQLEEYGENNTLSENTLYNVSDALFLSGNCENNTLSSNTIYNVTRGIYLQMGNNSLIANTIYDTYGSGIDLSDTDYNILTDNTVFNNAIGITLTGSYNALTENTICNTTSTAYGYGIYLPKEAEFNTIEDNMIYNVTDGIFLSEYDGAFCRNNTLSGNTIHNVYWNGILIDGGNNNSILSNTIYNTYTAGIDLFGDYNILFENTVFNNTVGITVAGSYNTLTENTIYNTTSTAYGYGIEVTWGQGQLIIGNEIYNVTEGIRLGHSHYNSITDNLIYNNAYGIYINYTVAENSIYNNVLTDNSLYGIFLDQYSQQCIIKWNSFYDNNFGEGSQASDVSGQSNLFVFNYWNDWTSPDDDVDGIVDVPYSIDGVGGLTSKDYYPLADPPPITTHIISQPIIWDPYKQTVSGFVTIQWWPSVDSLGHPVSYDIYLSNDGGNTWEMISSDEQTGYIWDTTEFPDGSNYKIRVTATCSEGLEINGETEIFSIQNQEPTTTTPTTTKTTELTSESSESTVEAPNDITPTPGWIYTILLLAVLAAVITPRRRKRRSK